MFETNSVWDNSSSFNFRSFIVSRKGINMITETCQKHVSITVYIRKIMEWQNYMYNSMKLVDQNTK